MPEALILEFEGVTRDQYDAVNAAAGIDPHTGAGDWPEGLLFHTGASRPGGWLVFEIWESKPAEERFRSERLASALQKAGVTQPPRRAEWLEVAAYITPAS